jgi:hypothetical protein
MKIRYTFGPKLNTIEHVSRDTAEPLIAAGIAEALPEPPRATKFNPISRREEEIVPRSDESLQDRQRARLGLTSQPAAVPVWDVVTVARTTVHAANSAPPELIIQMEILGGLYRWSGDPKRANHTADWDGGKRYLNGFGREIPDDVLGRYTALWKKNPTWRGSTSSNVSYSTAMASASVITGGAGDDGGGNF